jgi:hypothetical protein
MVRNDASANIEEWQGREKLVQGFLRLSPKADVALFAIFMPGTRTLRDDAWEGIHELDERTNLAIDLRVWYPAHADHYTDEGPGNDFRFISIPSVSTERFSPAFAIRSIPTSSRKLT